MKNPDRPSIVKIGVAAALAASALFSSAATAGADPGEPDPAPAPAAAPPPAAPPGPPEPPPPSQIGNPLAMSGTEQGPGGIPTNLSIVGNPNLIGQNLAPAAPPALGATSPVVTPNTRALNNQYLLPQNLMPAAPGKGEVYGVAPGEENADVSGGEYLGRLIHGVQDGQWRGGIVGRGTKESLNQPLPGTAPPPGTRIPGLGDDSQGPAPEQWHWTPPDVPEGAPYRDRD
ncbi:hypothetical protein [Mycobacteroides salmoniphilum]|uniref:hypothetical protein n=1 Tax=Mycobacteroides salmoniphilum TaxID=404941 RepID=UPI000BFF68FB|nr:hypothetical protein [Mycobacteroides salmoniphilum]